MLVYVRLLRRIIAGMLLDVNTMCWLVMTGIFLMNAEDMDKIKPGMIIFYNLPLTHKPRKPLKEWYGCVKKISYSMSMLVVTCLDTGYAGGEDFVHIDEVVRVEDPPPWLSTDKLV